jgi:putative membrane protein
MLLIHTIGIDNFASLWLQLKFIFVIILTIYHFFLFQCLRKFAENNNSYSPKFYRIINEIPTVLLIGIVLVVVFKPL